MTRLLSIAAMLFLSTSFASAEEFSTPKGDVLLTISGDIDQTNVGDTLQFDHEMLFALDKTIVGTSTIWTDGMHEFQGVSLKVLTELLDTDSGTLRATAVNDYSVEIPVSDAIQDGPILAYLMDGNKMSLRDKGPLWVIYPYDSSPEYRSEVIFSRSIWQLDRIEVVK